jgi:hypothetical protein
MATPANGLDLTQPQQPQAQKSQEHTSSAPMVGTADDPQNSGGITKEDQDKLIALVKRYKQQWSQNRIILMQRCLENLEFFKGNQFLSFGPGNLQGFDAGNFMGGGIGNSTHAQNADDTDLYRFCNNFYQMLAVGFIAALCPQVPKSKWMPEDAEELADVATAKAAQTIIDIVERDNKEASQLKGQLLYMFSCGAAFRHTRYIVDADRNGTKPQPVYDTTETTIMPARMHCFNCGANNPPQGPQCQNCNTQMGGDSFFPPVSGPVTRQVGTQEVPQGATVQDVYSPIDVDCDPSARNMRQTPILNLETEVHLSALRGAYPGMYSQIVASATSELSGNGSMDRVYRQLVYSQASGRTDVLADLKPTLSRTWIQPWAFDLEDDQAFGIRMRAKFPSGCLLINTGETFLCAQEADLNKEWTWAGTHEKFGLYPPAPGDIVVPFQKAYNDLASILRDGIDRGFGGILLGNNDLIGSEAMNGKQLLPCVINPVHIKRNGPPGSMKLSDAIFQAEINLHIQEGMEYCKEQMMNAQMFAMVPPQVYGGQGDPSIETAAGQKQQLGTAMGVLNIYWENLKDEHAAADGLAVECAQENLTEDLRQVIEEKGGYQNQYVRLDDLQGSVHAYADEDQGLPVSASELRQRWMDLLQAADDKNPVVQAIFDDPTNQEQAADALGVPGMVVPGAAMRTKTLMILEKLQQAQPTPQTNPQTGQPTGQMQPSIMPDELIDDFDVAKKTVRQYCQERPQIADDNPQGFQNILAYLTALTAMETTFNVQQAQQSGTVKGAELQAAAPPPPPPPQLSPGEQDLMSQLRKDAVPVLDDLVKIAGAPVTQQGQSYQGQVAAGSKVLDFVAMAEKLAADKTAPQQGQ